MLCGAADGVSTHEKPWSDRELYEMNDAIHPTPVL
jgi:hypothetical protein